MTLRAQSLKPCGANFHSTARRGRRCELQLANNLKYPCPARLVASRRAPRPETSVVSAPTVLLLARLFSDPLKSNNDRHLARHRSEAITARCGAFVWKRNGQSERRSSRVNTSVRRYMSFLQLNRVPKKMFAIVTSTFPNVLAQRPSSSFIIADVNLNLPAPGRPLAPRDNRLLYLFWLRF